MADATCSFLDCGRLVTTHGLCSGHNWQRRNGRPFKPLRTRFRPRAKCSVEDCPRLARSRGWCGRHYKVWRQHGDPLVQKLIIGQPERRFWSKVNKDGLLPDCRPELGPCWQWIGATVDGYGVFLLDGKQRKAHRVSYEWLCETVSDGLELDHLCRNRACVRPVHLEPVTGAENRRRGTSFAAVNALKTHCPKSHPYDEANTHVDKNGRRHCRACGRERMREVRAARRST